MKILTLFPVLAAAASGAVASFMELPPRSIEEFRNKHPWDPPHWGDNRHTFTIRPSRNDTDDISDEFVRGLQKANHGGTLHLKKGDTYVIGQPLDLTWLDDIHVNLEGEIKFTNDTPYWQANAFAHPFQVRPLAPSLDNILGGND